jgi:hypothetical protein
MKELSQQIKAFIAKYAHISPNWDGDGVDGKYTSPDAHMMLYAAEMLDEGKIPDRCWSEWGSGGYKPYSSKEGREEHDYLVTEIYKLINKK